MPSRLCCAAAHAELARVESDGVRGDRRGFFRRIIDVM